MVKNIGNLDKAVRIILGLLILMLGIVYSSWLGLIGLLLIVTALAGRCPLYLPLGITTKKMKTTQNK